MGYRLKDKPEERLSLVGLEDLLYIQPSDLSENELHRRVSRGLLTLSSEKYSS